MKECFEIIEKSFINNEWIDSNEKIEVINPATKTKIGSIPNFGGAETIKAIDCAETAFSTWSKIAPIERANLLLKWNELILKNKEALARLLSLEGGKSLEEARNEIVYGSSFIRWFAEEARRIYGDTIPADQANKRYLVIKQAIGVVGAITPWNFPNAMITRKCAPAIAAGCTVVLKPSELTPFSALALAKLALDAGFPKGVFNVITGDAAPIGKAFADDARVRKVSFTGSTRVGQILIEQSANTVKKLSLELGGNAPFIIFDDANLDKAVKGLIASKFRNSGQTCVCANRILIHESVEKAFIEKLIPVVKALKVGAAFNDESINIGPLINQAGLDKVSRLVNDAKSKGANCALGGNLLDLGGFFHEPTILSKVDSNMHIAHEEILGPIIALQTFRDDAEAVAIANNSPAGLASYIYTENVGRIWRISESLQYGMVGVNTGVFSDAITPFGGVKYSGYGREGSKYGIEEYIEIKSIAWDIS